MPDYSNTNMTNLYSSLGYNRNTSKRKFVTLDAVTSSFFREYVNQGNKVSHKKTDVGGARLCALNFLHEDERGERFWPVSADEVFQWAKDCDREEITDILTHIFRLKSFSDYVKAKKQIQDRWEAEHGVHRAKPKRVKKISKKRTHDDDDYLSSTKKGPTAEEKACIPSDLELNTVRFWKDLPEEPSVTYCGNYIRSLNPQLDPEPKREFQRNWLNTKSPTWPESADNRLLRFMFDHGLFITYDHGDEIPPGFLRSLREETEIEELTGSEYSKFQGLVVARVRELTHQLTQKPSLILKYSRDGVIGMTERFERFWKKRDVYWEDTPEPSKKRKKSKATRAKPPIVIPNLRKQDDVRSELLSSQVDQGSKLASMAESALDLFTQPQPDESDMRQGDQTIFTEFMHVDSDFERNTPASVASRCRSLSPSESIIVEHQRTGEAQTADILAALAPLRENLISDKEGSRSPPMEHIPGTNASGRPSLLLKLPRPLRTASPSNTVEATTATVTSQFDKAQKQQQATSESCSSTHEIFAANFSGAISNQSMSPTASSASRSFRRVNSTSPSISSSQHPEFNPSSPFEMLGSTNYPSISNIESTMTGSDPSKAPFPQRIQPMEGMIDEEIATGAQHPFSNNFPLNTMNTHSLLGADGGFGGYTHTSIVDYQGIATSTPPLSSLVSPSAVRQQTYELSPSPTQEGMVEGRGSGAVNEIERPPHATLSISEPDRRPFSTVDNSTATFSSSLDEEIALGSNSNTLDSDSQFSAINKSPKSPTLTYFTWQSIEHSDKVVTKRDAIDQSARQVDCGGGALSAAAYKPESVGRAITESVPASQADSEGQSAPRTFDPNQDCSTPSSTLAKGMNLSDPSTPADGKNSSEEIDRLVRNERTPSESLSLDPQPTYYQSTRTQSPLTQDTSIEEQEPKTLQIPLLDPVTASAVQTNCQTLNAQPEQQARPEASTQDLTPSPEKRFATRQEPLTPPTQGTPHRRNGFYSFVPPPEAFTPYKAATTPPPDFHSPPPPVLSTDRRLSAISTPSGAPNTPTLTLLIESADGSMSLETTHSFEIVKNSSLSEFFQFYSSVSGSPLSALASLEFQPAFGNHQSIEIRRYGGEHNWETLKNVIIALFNKAKRKDTEGRMEWQVLISCD